MKRKMPSSWKNDTGTLTYYSWKSMRARCLYDNDKSESWFGRGISVCDEWIDDYDKFVEDMGIRPEGTTLDRIDNNGNYELSNCRWATTKEQANNRRGNVIISEDGIDATLSEWADTLGQTDKQKIRAYKRHSKYKATTLDELFYSGNLMQKRNAEKHKECLVCGTINTCKWRENGTKCNTCYARERREQSQ